MNIRPLAVAIASLALLVAFPAVASANVPRPDAPPAPGPYDPGVWATPTVVQPGGTIAASGSCGYTDDGGATQIDGGTATILLEAGDPTAVTTSTTSSIITGFWSATIFVPAGAPGGTAWITATCNGTNGTSSTWTTITIDAPPAPEPAGWTIEHSPVAVPGGDIRISAPGCAAASFYATGWTVDTGTGVTAATTLAAVPEGGGEATVAVPADAAEQITVLAICESGGDGTGQMATIPVERTVSTGTTGPIAVEPKMPAPGDTLAVTLPACTPPAPGPGLGWSVRVTWFDPSFPGGTVTPTESGYDITGGLAGEVVEQDSGTELADPETLTFVAPAGATGYAVTARCMTWDEATQWTAQASGPVGAPVTASLDRDLAAPGDEVTVDGTGWFVGDTVTVTLNDSAPVEAPVVVGRVFLTDLLISGTTPTGPATVTVTGRAANGGGATVELPLLVASPTASPNAPGPVSVPVDVPKATG